MNSYFGVRLEFDRQAVKETISRYLKDNQKGYVCIVDATVLSLCQYDKEYSDIINAGSVNICDGSSIALLAGRIYKQRYRQYTGSDIYHDYFTIGLRQCFLGNTPEKMQKLKAKLAADGVEVGRCMFEPLPFLKVEDFDYAEIARRINNFGADLIWVSLGAPKQEKFIYRLLPYLSRGLCFAIGASINFYVGDEVRRAPKWLRHIHLEWLFRLCSEPSKQGKRVRKILESYPGIIYRELKNKRARDGSSTGFHKATMNKELQ